MGTQKQGGLAGVIAGETKICTVGQQGTGLTYRGYDIFDLASNASFAEVSYLLIYNKLPNANELQQYQQHIISAQVLPDAIKTILETLPKTSHPMDVLRTTCSALGCVEPETDTHKNLPSSRYTPLLRR